MYNITISDIDALMEAFDYLYRAATNNKNKEYNNYELANCHKRVTNWMMNKKAEIQMFDKVWDQLINIDSGVQFTADEMEQALKKLKGEQ